MENIDKKNFDYVHLLLALRRKKENPFLTALCVRKIRYNDNDINVLRSIINQYDGIWRIHKTVNKRDCAKASKILMHKLIDTPQLCKRMESLWKTCLLKPEARGERNFLLDFDGKNHNQFENFLVGEGLYTGEYGKRVYTPNGAHFITEPFDVKLIDKFKENVTVLRDGYIFVGMHKGLT